MRLRSGRCIGREKSKEVHPSFHPPPHAVAVAWLSCLCPPDSSGYCKFGCTMTHRVYPALERMANHNAQPGKARWGNQSASVSVEKYFAKHRIWELTADEVEIDSLDKHQQVMAVCKTLAKAMGKLKGPTNDVKVKEGTRRVNAMRLKLRT